MAKASVCPADPHLFSLLQLGRLVGAIRRRRHDEQGVLLEAEADPDGAPSVHAMAWPIPSDGGSVLSAAARSVRIESASLSRGDARHPAGQPVPDVPVCAVRRLW